MTGNLPARRDDLPTSLIDVVEFLGMEVAISLIENFGGQEIKFPSRPRADHPVITALGDATGRALCSFLGGQMIYVPHGRVRQSIRADVARMEAQGWNRAKIARALGVSQRHVRRMANSGGGDDRQLDLFKDRT